MKRTWFSASVSGLLVAASTACGGGSSTPAYDGQILFQSDREGPFEIYNMSADGSDARRLTTTGTKEDVDTPRERAALWPRWSPDGRRIVFQAGPPELLQGQIYVMNADGSAKRRLTSPSTGSNVMPAWSPNGAEIAFIGGSDARVYVMNANGRNLRPVTPKRLGATLFPVWAPDGERIAFICAEDREPAICAVSTRRGRVTTIVPKKLDPWAGGFDWSPDGHRIVFMGGADEEPDIYVIGVNGKGLRQLTRDSANDGYPVWSPDGRHIVFSSNRSGGTDLYVMNADGSDQQSVGGQSGHDDAPDWGRS